MTTVAPPVVAPPTIRLRPLSIVAQGDDFLVGDPERASFVVLPAIGVQVIELLRAGTPPEEARRIASADAGEDVDVDDFVATLCELGFAEKIDPTDANGPADTVDVDARPAGPPWWGPLVNGPVTWGTAALVALGCVVVYIVRPGLVPTPNDLFFLSTPPRSLVMITLLSYVMCGLHEGCHWLAARAEGVSATIRIDRRLYFLVFETNLTGMWSRPRRRRYWPLLIGMAFDAVLLGVVLALRLAADAGWWHPAPVVLGLLGALTFVQTTVIGTQFLIFLRTDMYGVLVVATGTFNLWEVTQLTVRERLRTARPRQLRQLAAAHPRDREVARWLVWVYAAGTLLAAAYFLTYFIPTMLRTVGWVVETLGGAGAGDLHLWEALAFSAVVLLPYALTAWVFVREGLGRRPGRHRADPPKGAGAVTFPARPDLINR